MRDDDHPDADPDTGPDDAPVAWVPLLSVGSVLEADLARQSLEEEGIPVLVRGHQVGIFGGGFQGTVAGGIDLLVPSPELERARLLLGLDD